MEVKHLWILTFKTEISVLPAKSCGQKYCLEQEFSSSLEVKKEMTVLISTVELPKLVQIAEMVWWVFALKNDRCVYEIHFFFSGHSNAVH